jgi:hypothetical protein
MTEETPQKPRVRFVPKSRGVPVEQKPTGPDEAPTPAPLETK